MTPVQKAAWEVWTQYAPDVLQVARDTAIARDWPEYQWPRALGSRRWCLPGYPWRFSYVSPDKWGSRAFRGSPGSSVPDNLWATGVTWAPKGLLLSWRWGRDNYDRGAADPYPKHQARDRLDSIRVLGTRILPLMNPQIDFAVETWGALRDRIEAIEDPPEDANSQYLVTGLR